MRVPLLLLAVPLLASCQALEQAVASLDRPSAELAAVRLADLSTEAVTLDLDVSVSNPYDVALPISAIDLTLSSGGTAFVSGTAPPGAPIPARGAATRTVTTRVPFGELMSVLSGVRPGDVVPYEANVALSVDAPLVGTLTLPLGTSGQLPVPAVPRVSVDAIRWDELGLGGASGVVSLSLANPNAFGFDVQDIDVGLRLAGVDVAELGLRTGARVEADGSASLELPIAFSPLALGTALVQALSGTQADYALAGNVAVQTPYGPLAFPLREQGRVALSR